MSPQCSTGRCCSLVEKVLNLRKQIFDKNPANKEYAQSAEEYIKFTREYAKAIKIERFELKENDKKELKKLYKQSVKLCHPDIVANEVKKQAHEIMQELNNAYSKNDLKKIKEILSGFQNGNGFKLASDSIDDKELLKSRIVETKYAIDVVLIKITRLEKDDTFILVNSIENVDDYFSNMKAELEREYENLCESED